MYTSPTRTEERIARAALTALFEPADDLARKLVIDHGAHHAYRIAIGARPAFPFADVDAEELSLGLSRWLPKFRGLTPEADLAAIERLGGGFLIPGDKHWPAALNDLPDPPYGLWYRGDISNGIPAPEKCVTLTGSRDPSAYGLSVTTGLAQGLAQKGICVISGLAYGIDTRSHEAAVHIHRSSTNSAVPSTIGVMACGLDRVTPAGNADLEAEIRATGLLVSELAPGTGPSRSRFVQRNRIMAALSGVTCVVEARWRSGALNTARRAASLGRVVSAVPGSVYSAHSAGCHQLLKDGAVLVTDTADILELLTHETEKEVNVT